MTRLITGVYIKNELQVKVCTTLIQMVKYFLIKNGFHVKLKKITLHEDDGDIIIKPYY